MRTCLVVANQTLGGEHLMDEVRSRVSAGSCRFFVLVPATRTLDHATWKEDEARAVAAVRLDAALRAFRAAGAEVDGRVGDHNPLLAIDDVLRERSVDEILLSTLPPGASRWLALDLPSRVRAHVSISVTHVIGEREEAIAS
jgi:GABA permease